MVVYGTGSNIFYGSAWMPLAPVLLVVFNFISTALLYFFGGPSYNNSLNNVGDYRKTYRTVMDCYSIKAKHPKFLSLRVLSEQT